MSSQLPAGTRLGRYEIRSKIGAGGMGEVYLARDTQLSNDFAIKVLPLSIPLTKTSSRFQQEACAVSARKGHTELAGGPEKMMLATDQFMPLLLILLNGPRANQ
jgi:serine/threonine protein kinase